jgi:hypothetical protein
VRKKRTDLKTNFSPTEIEKWFPGEAVTPYEKTTHLHELDDKLPLEKMMNLKVVDVGR